MRRTTAAALLLVSMFLSGCVTSSSSEIYASARPATVQEKGVLIEAARNALYDPYSVRDAELTDVVTVETNSSPYRLTCARFNSKNQLGGYTGRQTYLVKMNSRNQIMSATLLSPNAEPCSKLKWRTFVEAEQLRQL